MHLVVGELNGNCGKKIEKAVFMPHTQWKNERGKGTSVGLALSTHRSNQLKLLFTKSNLLAKKSHVPDHPQ